MMGSQPAFVHLGCTWPGQSALQWLSKIHVSQAAVTDHVALLPLHGRANTMSHSY